MEGQAAASGCRMCQDVGLSRVAFAQVTVDIRVL
jgi:hypothetical protein